MYDEPATRFRNWLLQGHHDRYVRRNQPLAHAVLVLHILHGELGLLLLGKKIETENAERDWMHYSMTTSYQSPLSAY